MAMFFPEQISTFLLDLDKALREKKWNEISIIYEKTFPELSDLHYSSSRWPEPAVVKEFYASRGRYHGAVLTLYTELTMRHIFASGHVEPKDRSDSFDNYEALFELLLRESCDGNQSALCISLKWLWGIFDEFVYQYQDTQRYKLQVIKKTGSAAYVDADLAGAYDPTTVKSWLLSFINRSNIASFLKEASYNAEYKQKEHLGYFSLIALVRFHCLAGDFYSALATASAIPMSPRAFYWKVPSANAILLYHLGVSYIMLGRYIDAVKAMSPLLVFVSKSSHYVASRASYEMRTIERMTILVRLCDLLSTSPLRIDEIVLSVFRDGNDKWSKFSGDDEGTFITCFNRSMPKFMCPVRIMPSMSTEIPIVMATMKHPLNQIFLENLLEKRRLKENVNSIRATSRVFPAGMPIDKITEIVLHQSPDRSDSAAKGQAVTTKLKIHCTQNVVAQRASAVEEADDAQSVDAINSLSAKPKLLQSDRVLVSTELSDFRLDHQKVLSFNEHVSTADRLEKLADAIEQADDLLTQVRKIQITDIPVAFSAESGEPVRMTRVKREDRKGRPQRAN